MIKDVIIDDIDSIGVGDARPAFSIKSVIKSGRMPRIGIDLTIQLQAIGTLS